jgi:hypothetical protein
MNRDRIGRDESARHEHRKSTDSERHEDRSAHPASGRSVGAIATRINLRDDYATDAVSADSWHEL